MKYCTVKCMKRAWYLRNKETVNAKARGWCKKNRAKRLIVQHNWNVSAKGRRMKRAWHQRHRQRLYALMKASGGVKLITARGQSRRILLRRQPDRTCVGRGRHEGKVECHHKDGNPFNYEPSNLEWRCRRHHLLAHPTDTLAAIQEWSRHPEPSLDRPLW